MHKAFLLFLIVLLQVSPLFSQTLVRGTITEFETGETLPFAQVTMKSGKPRVQPVATHTDLEGVYSIELTQEMRFIEFSFVGFLDSIVDLQDLFSPRRIRKGNLPDTLELNIRMKSHMAPPGMPPIVIVAHTDLPGDANKRSGEAINRQTGASLGEVMNTIPGLQFDERGLGGSRRISLRGSMLRSPFGVRNVRAYFNDAPLSSPDGSTPIELIEPRQLGEITVWKGPQGSWSGPGHGGRIDFRSLLLPTSKSLLSGQAEFAAGSFGLLRTFAGLNWKSRYNRQYRIQYTRQQYNGFREQEGNQKDQLEIHFHLPVRKRHVFKVDGWLFDGSWELPGGLDSIGFQTKPRAALPYSVTAQAAVFRQRSRLSLGHKWVPIDFLTVYTNTYGNLTNKENPFGTSPFFQGYKDEKGKGLGARSHLKYSRYRNIELFLGGEYQIENTQLDESENLNGQAGPLRFSADILSRHWLSFAGIKFQRGFHRLKARIGLDQTDYRFADLGLSETRQGYGVSPVLLPDLTYSVHIKYRWNLMVHLGTGYSPPTVWELLDQQGNPNLALKSERSQTIEVKIARARFARLPNRLHLEANAFVQRTRNGLVPRTLTNGLPYFENVGNINLRGIEWFLSKRFTVSNWGLRDVHLWFTATTQLATFGPFESTNGADLDGLWVPGLSRMRSSTHLEVRHLKNITLDLQWSYQGRMPLDEENNVFQGGFSLFNLKLKGDIISRKTLPTLPEKKVERFRFSPFLGINNLLDYRYNAFPVLNAARGRFFNVGAGRSFYGGIDFSF